MCKIVSVDSMHGRRKCYFNSRRCWNWFEIDSGNASTFTSGNPTKQSRGFMSKVSNKNKRQIRFSVCLVEYLTNTWTSLNIEVMSFLWYLYTYLKLMATIIRITVNSSYFVTYRHTLPILEPTFHVFKKHVQIQMKIQTSSLFKMSLQLKSTFNTQVTSRFYVREDV